MNVDVAVCVPREAWTVALIRNVVHDVLVTFGVNDECNDDIRLALSEACTNLVEHASDDEYEVDLHIDVQQS